MRKLLSQITPSLLLLFAACNARHQTKPYEGQWTQVTRINNEYVIYIPCAMDLRKMKVTEAAVHEVLPMEKNDCRIVKTTEARDHSYRLKGEEATYDFKWLDQQKGMAEWTIQHSPSSLEEKLVFVNSEHEEDFKKVKQPESECDTSGDAR